MLSKKDIVRRYHYDGSLLLSYVSDETQLRYERKYIEYTLDEAVEHFIKYINEQISQDMVLTNH